MRILLLDSVGALMPSLLLSARAGALASLSDSRPLLRFSSLQSQTLLLPIIYRSIPLHAQDNHIVHVLEAPIAVATIGRLLEYCPTRAMQHLILRC
jgi:hypothetical protein